MAMHTNITLTYDDVMNIKEALTLYLQSHEKLLNDPAMDNDTFILFARRVRRTTLLREKLSNLSYEF